MSTSHHKHRGYGRQAHVSGESRLLLQRRHGGGGDDGGAIGFRLRQVAGQERLPDGLLRQAPSAALLAHRQLLKRYPEEQGCKKALA